MKHFKIERVFGWNGTISERMGQVLRFFGMNRRQLRERTFTAECEFTIAPGQICCITGPSGSGKSVLLKALYEQIPSEQRICLDAIELETDGSVIDCLGEDIMAGLNLLSRAGLGDVYCVFGSPAQLSEGQRYRYRLIRALLSGKRYIFADEFCSCLDRLTARVICYQLGRYVSGTDRMFIAASSHEDILADLMPDILVVRGMDQSSRVHYRDRKQATAG